MAKVTLKIRDYSDEYSFMGVRVPDITNAANQWQLVQDAVASLEAVLAPMIMGTIVSWSFSQEGEDIDGDVRPASPEAQREKAIRMTYVDTVTNKRSSIIIPTANWSLSRQPGTDLVDLTWSLFAAWVVFFEGNVLSEAGNPVNVDRAVNVGRSN